MVPGPHTKTGRWFHRRKKNKKEKKETKKNDRLRDFGHMTEAPVIHPGSIEI